MFNLFSKKTKSESVEIKDEETSTDGENAAEAQENIISLTPQQKQKLEKLKRIQDVVDDFETSITQAKSSSSRSESSLASVHELLRTAEQDIEKNARLSAENEQLRQELQNILARLDTANVELDNKSSMIDSLKARSEETREALQQAHVDLSQNIKRVELLNGQTDDLRSRMNEQSFELASVNERLEKMETENEEMREQLKENAEEISVKSNHIAELEREASEAKRFQDIDTTRREQLSLNLDDMKIKLREMTREKIDIETKLEIAANDLNARTKHFKEQMRAKDDRIYALESKVEALEAHTRVNEQTVEQYQDENRDLLKAISDGDDRLRSVKSQMEQMKTSHNADREKLFASVNRISELELRISSLIDGKEDAIRENAEFSQMIDRLTNENKQLSERVISLNSLEAKYNKLVTSQEKLLDTAEDSKVVNLKSKPKKSA